MSTKKYIEDFLGLGQDQIEDRITYVMTHLPSYPGTEYIKQRLKEFQVQPWPFITYLMCWGQDSLREGLDCYRDYDGAENMGVIMEKLREYYILGLILEKADKINMKNNSKGNSNKQIIKVDHD